MGRLRENLKERRTVAKEFNNLGDFNKGLDTRINGQEKILDTGYNAAAPFEESASRNNFQTYPYDYFCGTNAKVFFGDIWVDDIVTIQYSVKQDKEPIYGYASQHFDALARGIIIVQGSFTIAFKEMGYLNVIQQALESQLYRASEDKLARKINTKLNQIAGGSGAFDPRLAALGDTELNKNGFVYNPLGQPDIIRQQQTIEDILMYKKTGGVVSSGLSKDILGETASSEHDFEDFAEILEDTLWGDSNGRPYNAHPVRFRRADEFDYNWDGQTDAGGIKIAKKLDNGDVSYAECLNIMITFGDINDKRAEHTMVVLNDVHIVNSSMVISPTGEPIGETYFFIARDINQTLSRETIDGLNPVKYNVGYAGENFKTATEEDITEIENFLKQQDSPVSSITIQSLSKFKYSAPGVGKWEPDTSYLDVFETSTTNTWESKLDQILDIVEKRINDPAGKFNTTSQTYTTTTNRTEYSQWTFTIYVSAATRAGGPMSAAVPFETYAPEGMDKVFNIVVDQQINNTLTYRIISPTRDNFGIVSTFTRGDLWDNEKPQIGLAKVIDESTEVVVPDSNAVSASAPKATGENLPETDNAFPGDPGTPGGQIKTADELAKEAAEKVYGPGTAAAQAASGSNLPLTYSYLTPAPEIQEAYYKDVTTTAQTGQAVTSSNRSHEEMAGLLHAGRYGEGTPIRGAVDIGNVDKNGKPIGYIKAPIPGEVISAGKSSFTVRTTAGQEVTYAHVAEPSSFKVGSYINVGQAVVYQEAEKHIHLQSGDIFGYELEQMVLQSGTTAGYRNTAPTVAPQITETQKQAFQRMQAKAYGIGSYTF